MKRTSINIIFSALVAVALSAVSVLAAGTDTWVGNTSANWNTTGNWTTSGGSTPPANGDSLVFGAAGSSGTSLNNDISSLSVNKFTFNSGASSFTFGGNGITISTGGIDASALTSGTMTFTPTITIGNGFQRWNVGAGATLAFGSLGAGADANDLFTPNGAMVILSSTGTKTTTTADGWGWRSGAVAGTGLLGPGMVIDNGNNTYDWASVGTQTAGTSHAIVAPTYTTAVNTDAHNVRVTGNTTVSPNASWASLLVSGATLTANTGGTLYIDTGIILQNGGTIAGSCPLNANADGHYIYVPDTGTISSRIQNGAKLLYKAGAGTLTLNAAINNNTYTGGTKVYQGALTLANGGQQGEIRGALTIYPGATVNLNAADALGWDTVASGVTVPTVNIIGGTLNNAISGNNGYATTFNLTGGTMMNSVANTGTQGFNFNGSSSAINSLASSAVSTISAPVVLRANGLTITTAQGTVPSGIDLNISGGIQGGYDLAKAGAGTLQLSGVNTYTGTTTVNAGTLTYSGTLGVSPATAAAQINVGVAGGGNATLNIQSGANIRMNNTSMLAGNGITVPVGDGFVFQSGSSTITGMNQLQLGAGASGASYGYYNLSGTASISMSEFDLGGFNGAAVGVCDISGGTMNVANWFVPSRAYTAGGAGILNLTGGTFNYNGPAGQFLGNWNAGSGVAVINVANASLVASSADVNLMQTGNAGNLGQINLLSGGLMQAHSIAPGSATGNSLVNFNGGTLKASTATTTFLTANNTAVNVYGGGGTIDNNGINITIPKALTAPSGSGINGTVTFTGGSGYVGAPAVTFSGGGSGVGAAGYATISGGAVNGIVVTCPGTGYGSAPTITLTGGGYTVAATATAPTPTANTSGGMTFKGSGTTTLSSGASTYSGGSTLSAGQITLGASSTGSGNSVTSGPLGTGTLTLSGGTLQLNAQTLGNNLAVTASTSSIVDNTANNGTLGGDVSGSGTITIQNTSGNNLSDNLNGSWSGFTGTLNYTTSGSIVNIFAATSMDLSHATVNIAGNNSSSSFRTAGTTKLGSLAGSNGYLDVAGTAELGNLNASTSYGGLIRDNGGAGAVTKVGTGTLTLTGADTYTGATTINGGTLCVDGASGAINSSSGITINGSGAKYLHTATTVSSRTITQTLGTVDGTGTLGATINVANSSANVVQNGNGGTATLTIGTLAFGGAATVNIAQSGTAGTPGINVTGTLSTTPANGQVTVNASAVSWTTATPYNLIGFGTQGFALGDFTKGTVTGLSPRQSAALVLNGNNLALQCSGDSPKWTGLDSASWVVGATGGSNNWKMITGGAATDYIEGDGVVFDDSATNAVTPGVVTISAANISPTATSFNNTSGGIATYTVSGAYGITNGLLAKSGSGTLVLNTVNSYTGGTTINGGTIQAGNSSALGAAAGTLAFGASSSGKLQVNGNAITVGGLGSDSTATIENANGAAGSLTVNSSGASAFAGTLQNGPGGGALSLTSSGSGTLTLSGASGFSGGTFISAGTVIFGNNAAFGTGAVTLNGGSIKAGGVYTLANNIAVSSTATFDMAGNNTTWNGNLSGSAALTLNNSGVASTLDLNGNNSGYSGTMTFNNNNAVNFDSASAGSAGAAWVFNDSGADRVRIKIAGGGSISFGSIAGSGQMQNDTAGTTSSVSVGALGTSTTFSGTIKNNGAGVLALTKVGNGALTLSNNGSTYSGGTTVSNGTVVASANNALGSGTVTLSGGTLGYGAAVTLPNAFAVTTGTTNRLQETSNNALDVNGSLSGGGWLSVTSSVANNVWARMHGNPAGFTGTIEHRADSYLAFGFDSGALGGTVDLSGARVVTVGPRVSWNRFGFIDNMTADATMKIGEVSGSGVLAGSYDGGGRTYTFEVGALNTDSTFSGVIENQVGGSTGYGALRKVGTGTLTLSGANTYSGATVINNGTLRMGAGGTTGTLGAGAITNDASLAFNYGAAGNVTFNNAISGTGMVALTASSGTPRVHFGGANTYSGTTAIGANVTLEVNASSGASSNSDFTVNGVLESYNNIASLAVGALNGGGTVYNTGDAAGTTSFAVGANGHSGTFSGVVANGAWGSRVTALTKSGAGTQTLSGANTYGGATTISAGMLTIGGSGTLGSGSYSAGITDNGAFVYNSSANQTFSGIISGTGSLTKTNSASTLTLSNGSSAYSGGTTLSAGQITLGASSTGAGASVTQGPLGTSLATLSGGTLQMNAKTLGNNLTAATATTTIIDNTGADGYLDGNLSGGGTLTMQNSSGGGLSLNIGQNAAADWSGFTGTLNYYAVNGQVFNVFLRASCNLSNAGLSFGGSGTPPGNWSSLRTSGTTQVGALSGSKGYLNIAGVLQIGNLNTNTAFGGYIIGSGGLTKVGTGTLTLSAANTYSGSTTVAGGTLELTGSIASSLNVSVTGIATLHLTADTGLSANTVLTIAGGQVNIDPSKNQAVKRLYLGTQLMWPGTWGSSACLTADNHNDTCFAGSGMVTVTEGAPHPATVILFR
jgi:fibronectin-binding autotransporter adhesin